MSSWNPALPADTSKMRLSAGYIRNNETAVQTVITAGNLTAGYPLFPLDGVTAIYFYANAAPSGWTLLDTVSDCLLGIIGGSSAYNVSGQQVVGTWNGPAYALTSAQIPTLSTNFTVYDSSGTSRFSGSDGSGPSGVVTVTLNSGGGNTHEHDWTTTRPTAAVGILCTKNM